jgi:hypothetical protein
VNTKEVSEALRFFGEDHDTRSAVVSGLVRMPADVSEFALDRCIFTSIGKAAHGVYFPIVAGMEGMWVVELDERLERDDLESVMAHEVAHIWLEHPQLGTPGEMDAAEVAAASLVKLWGFTGKGAKPTPVGVSVRELAHKLAHPAPKPPG